METVPHVAAAIQQVLGPTADRLAKQTGCVVRERQLTGSRLVQALVFGWLNRPRCTLADLAGAAATAGSAVSRQAVHRRFGEQTAQVLYAVLCEVVERVFVSDPVAIPLLRRFTGVYVQDGSVIALPTELAQVWTGCGGSNGASAAVKLGVRLDLLRGGLRVCFRSGRAHDRSLDVQSMPVPAGALRLADLGFFDLDVFERIGRDGGYFLSRVQAGTVIHTPRGVRTSVGRLLAGMGGDGELVDIPILLLLGAAHKLPVRLIAQQVPPQVCQKRREKLESHARTRGQRVSATRIEWAQWTIYVTNAPQQLLGAGEALVLARARWQIEQLFRFPVVEVGGAYRRVGERQAVPAAVRAVREADRGGGAALDDAGGRVGARTPEPDQDGQGGQESHDVPGSCLGTRRRGGGSRSDTRLEPRTSRRRVPDGQAQETATHLPTPLGPTTRRPKLTRMRRV